MDAAPSGKSPRSPIVRGAGLAVIGLAIAVGGGLAWGANSSNEHSAPAKPRTTAIASPTAATTSQPARQNTERSAHAPQKTPPATKSASWTGIVEGLYAQRARAVGSADPAQLAGVYTSDSEVGAADVARAHQMRDAGYRAAGFAPTVISVSPRSIGDGAARLRVVDTLPAYRLMADGRLVSAHPARPPHPWDLTLKREGGSWRIATLEAAK